MKLVIINGNPVESDFNMAISEIIYILESKGADVRNIVLKNFVYKPDRISQLNSVIADTDMIIYASPIIEGFISKKLINFLTNFKASKHPDMFIILEGNNEVTVDSINTIVEYFERFSKDHNSKIIDIQYLSDATNALLELI